MELDGTASIVTGGASGLGLATARALATAGSEVLIVDRDSSAGARAAEEGRPGIRFVAADVTDETQLSAAFRAADFSSPLRAVVHCAGVGSVTRVLDGAGEPGSLSEFERVVSVNLVGTFNTLRLAAAIMARTDPVEGERGAIVMTASAAAFEGQIGQIAYAASKGGVVAMTLCAARDLASKLIRVNTIAPGLFETPLFDTLSEDVRASLGASVPHPRRLGAPAEYADMALALLRNPVVNGETVRLDGALRMAPR